MTRQQDPERRQVRRTIRSVDSRVWGLFSVLVAALAIAVLVMLVLDGGDPPQTVDKTTTPAPAAVPVEPR